ncbi:MAG TPA: hypothetical protein VG649_04105 [Candidatus Angelobacter sp.]|jgi:hypothetical protein|nr:hypothetical protein [Candidatus Angelobacter sp.]
MKGLVRTCLLSLVFLGLAAAQTVTVQRRTNLRLSPSTRDISRGVLNSHTNLDLLHSGPTDGFYHVRTQSGLEGWIWGRNVLVHPVSVQPILHLNLRSHLPMPLASTAAMGRDDCPVDRNGCRCYQHKGDNGKCQDDPGVTHHGAQYDPQPGEECWVITLCLCREGQYPSGNSCAPCSYSGEETVCRSR